MGAVESAYTTPSTCPTCGGLKLPPQTATRLSPALDSTLDPRLARAGPADLVVRGARPPPAARRVAADEGLARLAEDQELGGHDVRLVEQGLVVDEDHDPAVEDLDGAAVLAGQADEDLEPEPRPLARDEVVDLVRGGLGAALG